MQTDDTQAPESALDNNNALSDTNEQLGTWARWFIDLRLGLLSEGQVVTLTGLDRLTVREIDDLFNQALTQIEALLTDPQINAGLKAIAGRLASAPERARVILFDKLDDDQAAREGWTKRLPLTMYNRTPPPVDQQVWFLLNENGAVGVGFARFDHDKDNPLCSAGSYYEIGGNVWEGEAPIGWLTLEQAVAGMTDEQAAAPEVKS